MSGAGDSETPSVSASRSVRSAIGKSGGASIAASTAATRSWSLAETCRSCRRPHSRDRCRRDRYQCARFPSPSPACLVGGARGSWRRPDCRASDRTARPAQAWLAPEPLCRQRRRRAVELLIELFEHASGVFATRHAKVQPFLGFGKQCVSVILAVIAALAQSCCPSRPSAAAATACFGKFHALGERHGRIVPRRAVFLVRRCGGRLEESRKELGGLGGTAA